MDAKESAAKIKAAARRTLTLPSNGAEVVIRKLGQRDFMLLRTEIPVTSTVIDEAELPKIARRITRDEAPKFADFAARLICTAVISPKVILEGEPTEDEIAVDDLAVDILWLVDQIMEFAGLGAEASEVEQFRAGEAEQPDSPGCAGETVREDAPRTPEPGIPGPHTGHARAGTRRKGRGGSGKE